VEIALKEKCHVVNEAKIFCDIKNAVNYIIIPHVHNKDIESDETAKEYIKRIVKESIDPTKKNVLLGHFHIEGSLAGSENTLLANKANDISPNEELDLTICGHIHKHQFIKSKNGLVPGSIIINDFGERNE